MLDNNEQDIKCIHFDETDSTNSYAGRLIEEYRKSGRELPACTLITADRQTAGRGRSGRSFASPGGGSIYMTLLMRVDEVPEKCMTLTPAAAVGTLTALEEAGSAALGIKWVNDLLLGDRKVCGILTEAVPDRDGVRIEYVIIGIGINIDLGPEMLPEDVRGIAGSLRNLRLTKQELITSIARHVRREAEASVNGGLGFMRIYRERSVLIGREIVWTDALGRHTGTVSGINDTGGLEVREDGTAVVLTSGEVSVRRL